MRIGAIVQARMSSRRLPGKVLVPIAGRPLLQYTLERLSRCRSLAQVAVATTRGSDDDAVAGFCIGRDVPCWRGPSENVALRFREAAEALELDAFVRVCADSPLIDTALVDRAVRAFRGRGRGRGRRVDLVTNIHPRTFPPGQSVEVVDSRVFARAVEAMTEPAHREHVTRCFYEQPERYRIHNIESGRDYGQARHVVDTPEDLARIEALIETLERPHWQYGLDDLVSATTLPGRVVDLREVS